MCNNSTRSPQQRSPQHPKVNTKEICCIGSATSRLIASLPDRQRSEEH